MQKNMLRKILLFVVVIPMLCHELHALMGGMNPDPRQKDFSTLNPGYENYIIDSDQPVKYASKWAFIIDAGFVVFDLEAITSQAIQGQQVIDFLFSDTTEENQSLCKISLFDAYSNGSVTFTDQDNNDYSQNNYTINERAFKLSSPSYWITFNNGKISFGKGRDYTDVSTVLTTWTLQQDFGDSKKVYFTFNNAGSSGYYLMIKNITWGDLDKTQKKDKKKSKKRTSKKKRTQKHKKMD